MKCYCNDMNHYLIKICFNKINGAWNFRHTLHWILYEIILNKNTKNEHSDFLSYVFYHLNWHTYYKTTVFLTNLRPKHSHTWDQTNVCSNYNWPHCQKLNAHTSDKCTLLFLDSLCWLNFFYYIFEKHFLKKC